jgi:hypothetical protein
MENDMSEKINDGGPAFPNVPDGAGDRWADWDVGMSLRDYFAATALKTLDDAIVANDEDREMIAKRSYQMADAMLKARG